MSTRLKTVFACQACGLESSKWLGRCPDCGEWNSFAEERQEPPASRASAASVREHGGRPQPYDLVDVAETERLPSGIGEFDRVLGGGIVPGSMVLIGGEPGIGKCLAGSTRLLDPGSGAWLPITEWARCRRSVVSLDESAHRLQSQMPISFHDQGIRPVIELNTRLGRTLRCTPTHPVLTPNGWRAAGDLGPGARLASPRSLPYFGSERMRNHHVKLVAYVLSDGSAQSDVNVTTALSEVQSDLKAVAGDFGLQLRAYPKPRGPARTYRLVQPRGMRAGARAHFARCLAEVQAAAGLTSSEWARRAGVSYSLLRRWRDGGCVPSAEALERLAAVAGDAGAGLPRAARSQAEMTTEAARLLSSVGLRFCTAAEKRVPDCIFRLPADQLRLFLEVLFTCDGSVYVSARGQAGISYSSISEQLCRDVQHLLLRFGFVSKLRTKTQRVNGQRYVAYEIQLLGLRQVKRYLREIGIRGREGDTVAALAVAYPSPALRALGQGDVYWDEVTSVRAAGEERVYDLSMPSHQNFVANDLIVHNSTLLLQVAHLLSRAGPVLYVSGEESERQIKLRGDRLGIRAPGLLLLSETSLERILDQVEELKPFALVVDSVQTVYSSKFPSAPGSITQVREVATQLLFLAKGRGLTTFLIGHVTKDGNLAGPKSLEHIVDTVLYFEGEKRQHHRIVRAVKNRFGAVSEMGVFEMTGGGLQPVANPSALFLSERREGSAGSAVVATLEGSRPMLVEVQALVSPTSFGTPRRMSLGIDPNRTTLLLAVLEKRVGLALLGDDVFVSVAGGLEVAEPAADLGVAAAVASSFRNRALPAHTALFGEVGLAGEVRGVGQAVLRLREAAQMGFTRCLLPARSLPDPAVAPEGIEAVGVHTLQEALERLFSP